MSAPGPGQPVVATTIHGQPIHLAFQAAAGEPQAVGVLADGRPVWPTPPGADLPDGPQPFGVLDSGELIWVKTPSRPFYQKKRVLIPAAAFALLFVAGVAGGGDNSSSGTTDIRTAGAASDSNAANTAPVPVAISPEEKAAADKAAAEKAAADKAASDKAAADKAAADKAAADKAAADKAAADKAAAEKAAADKAAADKAAADKAAAERGPAGQQALLQAVVVGREAYEDTDNELKQRQAQRERAKALRAAVPGLKVSDWVGEIRSIDTNSEGKAVVELNIGHDTKLGTWNNALSDSMHETLISMDSSMYETLVNLSEGDRVSFSGMFFSEDEQGLREKSLTFHGQMKTPNFVFRFSEISPIG